MPPSSRLLLHSTDSRGYDDRFDRALSRAQAGDPAWVTGVRIDSCHTVWMELHEDLLATLGIARGAEPLLG